MSNEYVNDISSQKKREASISDASHKLIEDDAITQELEMFEIPKTTRFSDRLKKIDLAPLQSNKPTRKSPKNAKRKK